MSVIADSSRGLVYFDSTSGEYPPTGFSFGIINATTHDVIKVLPLDVNPGSLALDQRTGDVYVAGSTSIAVLDGENQSFVRDIEVGHQILSIAYDSSVSRDLFVTSGSSLFSLNPQTGAIVGNVTFADDLDGIQLDPSNGKLFVGQYPNGEISVLNSSDLAHVGTIGLPGCCALQFALDDRTQVLYAATGTNYVYVVNAAEDTLEKSLEVTQSSQNSTNAIVVDNMTGSVFVASSPGGSVVEIDGSSGSVSRVLKVASQAAGLALDTRTQELYVANYHQLTVFDAKGAGTFLLAMVAVAAVVAAGAIGVYAFIRRRKDRERRQIEEGTPGIEGTSRG
jgi:DNA-binding beta-propeller fold protein YncE